MAGNGDGAHERTYVGFVRMFGMGTAVVVVIAALVVWLIAS